MNRSRLSVSAILLLVCGAVLYPDMARAQTPAVSIAPLNQSVTEGADAVFIVTVSGMTTMPTTATYLVTGIGAQSGARPQDLGNADNTMRLESFPSAATVFIEAGMNATATIVLPIFRDGVNEPAERFAVRLTGAEGGATALSDAMFAVVTIPASSDFTISLAGPVTATEGDAVEYDFGIAGATLGADLQVPYRVEVGGAASADDLQILTPGAAPFSGDPATASGRLTIAASVTTSTLVIRIVDDMVAETMAESIVVSIDADVFFTGNNNVFPDITDSNSIESTLADPSAGRVILSSGPVAAVAEGGTASFIVRIVGVTDAPVTVTYAAAAFGAEPASAADFGDGRATDFPSGMVTIPAGTDSSATIALPLFDDDSLPEREETFSIVLTGAEGGGMATLTLADSRFAAAIAADGVTIAAPSTAPAEGGEAVFVVTARGQTTMDTIVTWSVSSASASGATPATPQDLGDAGNTAALSAFPSGRSVTIGAGMNSTAAIRIPVFDDVVNEGREVFDVTLISAEGGMTVAGPPPLNTAQGVIADSNDDFTYSLSGPTTAVEGDTLEYTVRLHGGAPLTDDLSVAYQIENIASGGVSGDDYQVLEPAGFAGHGAASMLEIPAGNDRIAVRVRFTADAAQETPEELFRITLSGGFSGNNGVFPTSNMDSIRIDTTISDPPIGRVVLAAGPGAPVAEGGAAYFTVRVVGLSSATTVRYAVAGSGDNPATAADFGTGQAANFPSGSIEIAAGMDSSATLSIPLAVDVVTEPEETFALTLLSADSESLAQPILSAVPSIGAVIAADAIRVISLIGPETAVAEGGVASFTVHLSGSTTRSARVSYRVSAGTGAQPQDLGNGRRSAFPEGTLTLRAIDDSTANLSIPVHDDALNESTETFVLALGRITVGEGGVVPSLAAASSVTVAITDNDPITVALDAPGQAVAEGDAAVFTVEVSGGVRDGNLTMAWAITGTTAGDHAAAADFGSAGAADQFPAGVLTFAPGDSRMTISVPLWEDFVREPEETFVFQLERAAAAGAVSASTRATVAIAESVGRTRVFAVTGPEYIDEGRSGTYTVTFESGTTLTDSVMLTWTIEGRGAEPAQQDDFSGELTGALTFAVGAATGTTRSFTIHTNDDVMVEGEERFALALAFDGTEDGVRMLTAAIRDNDEITATLSGGGQAAEGGDIAFAVTLGGSTRARVVAIPWRIAMDTSATTADADAGDYEPDSGFFIVEAAATTAMLNLSIVDDDVTERAEAFVLHLGAATTGAGSFQALISSQAATIMPSDPRRVVFAQTAQIVRETSGVVGARLRFDPPGTAGEDVTVRLTPVRGSGGIIDADYRLFDAAGDATLAAGTQHTRVTLPAGARGAPAEIEIQNLPSFENDRTLSLGISDALIGGTTGSAVTVGEVSSTDITIRDDSGVRIDFLRTRHDFVEDTRATPVVFTEVSNIGGRVGGQAPLQIVIRQIKPPPMVFVEPSLFVNDTPTKIFSVPVDLSGRQRSGSLIIATNFSITDDDIGLEDEEVGTWSVLTHAEAIEVGEEQDSRIAEEIGVDYVTEVAVLDNEFVRVALGAALRGTVTARVTEGSTLNVPWTLTSETVGEVVAGFSISNLGTTAADYDLTISTSGAVRTTRPEFMLPIVDDDIAEEDEQFRLHFRRVTTNTSGIDTDPGEDHSAVITIVDNDDIRIDFEQTHYTVSESAGAFDVCLAVPAYTRNQTVMASVAVNDGTAVRGTDYVVIGDGDLSDFTSSGSIQRRCLNVEIADDILGESDEVFTLALQFDDSPGSRIASVRPVATVTIEDDEILLFGEVSSLYADQPDDQTCGDCGNDDRIVYRLANPAVDGATFGFDVQVRLTPPDGVSPGAFVSQSTFGIVHDNDVLSNCRARHAGLTRDRGPGAFYLLETNTATTGTSVWTFSAAGAGAYDPGNVAANRARFGELTSDYRDLFHIDCDIADAAAHTDVSIAAAGWNGLRTLVSSGQDRAHLAYAANRFEGAAMDGGPWAVEVNLYGDGLRADLVMNQPMQPVSAATFALTGDGVGAATVTGAALAAESTRVVELTLSQITTGTVVVATGQTLTAADGSAAPDNHPVAQLPAHDAAAPAMTGAVLEDNNTVRLTFDAALRADTVSTGDFVLSVLEPDGVTGVEVVSLEHSDTTVTLVVRTLGGLVQEGAARSRNGDERLRVRLGRNFVGDLVDNVDDANDHVVATHQLPSHALAFADDLRPTLVTPFTAVARTTDSGMYSMTFQAGFSEAVNLGSGSFRVLEVDVTGDNTGGTEVAGINVAAAMTEQSAAVTTYTITLGPLTSAQHPASGNGYAVELVASMISDEGGNRLLPAVDVRALSGGHNGKGVFHASEDFDSPMLTGAVLNAANTTLTLTFDETVDYIGNGGSPGIEIEVTENPWITTVSVTSITASDSLLLVGIETQGPPPLDGLSATGGEQATVTLEAGSWRDVTGNPGAEASENFTFNDNAAPAIADVALETSAIAGGTSRRVIWTVTFTEPVSGVAADSFDVYTLTSSTASISDGMHQGGADTFAGAGFELMAGAMTASYTLVLREPFGPPVYYVLATTSTNVIRETAPMARALGDSVQTGPDGARGLLALFDQTPPEVVGRPSVSSDNTTIFYRFNENLRLVEGVTTANLITAFNAGISTAMAAAVAGDPAGYDRTGVLNDAISGISVTGATLDGMELRLAFAVSGPAPLSGAVPVTATDFLRIAFPADVIEDIVEGVDGGNAVAVRNDRLTLFDTAPPQVASVTRRGDPMENPDTTSAASWTVTFTEPVDNVDSGDFVLCEGATATACTTETTFTGTVINTDADVSREYAVSTSSLVQQIGASVFYSLRLDGDTQIAEKYALGREIEGLPFTAGEAHEVRDTVAPVLESASLDFPAGRLATATFVFNEAVDLLPAADFNTSVRIAVSTGSEWITGAVLAGAPVADGANLHIPLQTTGAAPLNGGSADGTEVIEVELQAGAVVDVPGYVPANAATFQRQLSVPENAPPQLRLRMPGSSLIPDFRANRVFPDTGGKRIITWRIRFTEAVDGVTSASFTLFSTPGVTEETSLEDLAASLTSDAGVMGLRTSATTFSSFTVSPVLEGGDPPVVTRMSGSDTYSDTWELMATGLDAANVGTMTLAHYVVRFEETQAVTEISDDEGRSYTGFTPARPVWSEVQSAGDIGPPQVVAEAEVERVPDNRSRLLLHVTVEDLLTTTSVATFADATLGVSARDGAPANAAALPHATVAQMELMPYSDTTAVRVRMDTDNQTTTLTFRARLSGSLDDGESAVGGERFAFTIPGGRLTDVFGNTQDAAMMFMAEAPESGAPEVTTFGVLSSVESAPNSGVFNLRYLVEFTEPVAFASTALALYSSPDRRQPPLTAPATTIDAALAGVRLFDTPPLVESTMTQARYIVTWEEVRRPPANVRGYVAFIAATDVAESSAPMTKTVEDCPYYETAPEMPGCLSASADVSDVSPPRFRGAGYAGSRLWLQFDEPARVLAAGAEVADGAVLEGFEVLPGDSMMRGTSSSVVVNRAVYRVATQSGAASIAAIVLELDGVIQSSTEATVWVRYTPPADTAVAGIYDNADLRGLNDAPNRITRVQSFTVSEGRTADSDGDGIPDAAEIAYGGSPLVALSDAERAALPQVLLSRGAGADIAIIAYSGIRAHGADLHLGVSTTGSVAARRAAYYLTDTFGYTPSSGQTFEYGCSGQFPANYAAPVADGGCAVVDFADIVPGMDHRIGWLATAGSGYWLPQGTTSTLLEQNIRRVPELNMNTERLFFLAADAQSATATVTASHDGPEAASDLTLALTTNPGGAVAAATGRKEFSVVIAKSDVTSDVRTWGIAGLSGGGASLWRAGTDTDTGTLTAASYSLGLAMQTEVVRLADDSLPPTAGLPVLYRSPCCNAANIRSVLAEGDFVVALPVENLHASLAPAVTATGAGVLSALSASAVRSGADDEIRVALSVAAVTTPTSVTLHVSAPGRGATATVTLAWPVVASGNVLADEAARDEDDDGIADVNDRYLGDGRLPVSVSSPTGVLAGADSWHHIRPVQAGQNVRTGALALRRAAMAATTLLPGEEPPYSDYASSFFDIEDFEVVYDFSVYGVDYSAMPAPNMTATTIAGGRAGVIIPLPQSLYDAVGLDLFKYREGAAAVRFETAPGGNDYGYAPLADGACPDDTGAAGSRYRGADGALRRPKSAGDACLVVYVLDGGDYDEDDANPNGVVHDPLGLRFGTSGGARTSGGGGGGGGSFGIAGLLMLMLAAMLAPLRRRSGFRLSRKYRAKAAP